MLTRISGDLFFPKLDWSLLDKEDLEYYCSIYDEEITE